MNGAVAGIMSPVVFGWILTQTGSWTTPFALSIGLLLFAIVIHQDPAGSPDRGGSPDRRLGGSRGVDP